MNAFRHLPPALRHAVSASALLPALALLPRLPAAERPEGARVSNETRAVIVVTGLRLNEDPERYVQDRTVGEGAVATVTPRGGTAASKPTRLFQPTGGNAARAGFFTADFVVDLDRTYEIALRFADGTTIRIEDFTLPKEWRTHFYFHSTRGTLSPASVLRVGRAPPSELRCHVYAVFPLANYHALGGRQIE